jgi:hypothetical protein
MSGVQPVARFQASSPLRDVARFKRATHLSACGQMGGPARPGPLEEQGSGSAFLAAIQPPHRFTHPWNSCSIAFIMSSGEISPVSARCMLVGHTREMKSGVFGLSGSEAAIGIEAMLASTKRRG